MLTDKFKVVGFPISRVVTNVYGPQKVMEKCSFISSLKSVRYILPNEHWVVGGDFNLITSLEEKKGGR